MKVFGRILSILGWLLVVGSFAGGMLNFTFPTLVPGFILLFFGRVVRSANKARPIPDSSPDETPPPAPRRPPPPLEEPKPSIRLEDALKEIESRKPAPEPVVEFEIPVLPTSDTPMSSAEMIERARSRWDRKT